MNISSIPGLTKREQDMLVRRGFHSPYRWHPAYDIRVVAYFDGYSYSIPAALAYCRKRRTRRSQPSASRS